MTMNTTLSDIEKARQYVQSLRGQWTALSAHTGLNGHWITAFSRGRLKEPGYDKIKTVLADTKRRKT